MSLQDRDYMRGVATPRLRPNSGDAPLSARLKFLLWRLLHPRPASSHPPPDKADANKISQQEGSQNDR